MKILVTGAFGGVGVKVIEAGYDSGHSMFAFDLRTKRNLKTASRFDGRLEHIFWGDLRNREDVARALSGMDAVIHLGAVIPPLSEKNPDLAYDVNVGGTENVIDSIRAAGDDIPLIYTSSMSIMGCSADRKPPLRVTDPICISSSYTAQKIECEKIIRHSGIRWIIARLGAVVNTELSAGGGSLSGIADELFSLSLDNRIEGVWNVDVAEALLNAAVLMTGTGRLDNRTFFIGGGRRNGWQLTVRELYSGIFNAAGIGMFSEDRFSKEPYYADWLDTADSQRFLNYQNHSFDEFQHQLRKAMGMKRLFIRLFSGIIRRVIERR